MAFTTQPTNMQQVADNHHGYFGNSSSPNFTKVMDPEQDAFLRRVRALPHNLDSTGNSTIKAFQLFRVGQFIYVFDAWQVCFFEYNRTSN